MEPPAFEATRETFSRAFAPTPLDDLERDRAADVPERRVALLRAPFDLDRVRELRELLDLRVLLDDRRLLPDLDELPLLERPLDRVLWVAILVASLSSLLVGRGAATLRLLPGRAVTNTPGSRE